MKLIFYFAFPVLVIWNIVEFILYVAHRDPFNWFALWSLIVDFVIVVCVSVDSAIRTEKQREEMRERNGNPFGSSRFHARLEEMQRRKAETKKTSDQ